MIVVSPNLVTLVLNQPTSHSTIIIFLTWRRCWSLKLFCVTFYLSKIKPKSVCPDGEKERERERSQSCRILLDRNSKIDGRGIFVVAWPHLLFNSKSLFWNLTTTKKKRDNFSKLRKKHIFVDLKSYSFFWLLLLSLQLPLSEM